jgi:hypothetical protein
MKILTSEIYAHPKLQATHTQRNEVAFTCS